MSELRYKALLTMMMNAAKEACHELDMIGSPDENSTLGRCGLISRDLEGALIYVQQKLDESQMVPLFGDEGDEDDGKTS